MARVLLCVSTRVCLWETLWFLARGRAEQGIPQVERTIRPRVSGKLAVEVQYPTVSVLRKMFSPFFALRSWSGVGVAVPPSYLEHLARRYPEVLAWPARH